MKKMFLTIVVFISVSATLNAEEYKVNESTLKCINVLRKALFTTDTSDSIRVTYPGKYQDGSQCQLEIEFQKGFNEAVGLYQEDATFRTEKAYASWSSVEILASVRRIQCTEKKDLIEIQSVGKSLVGWNNGSRQTQSVKLQFKDAKLVNSSIEKVIGASFFSGGKRQKSECTH